MKKYNYYDLVGVYQVDSVYKVVDYKRVSELVQKECGYRLVEIPKPLYLKLSANENKISNNQKTTINNEGGNFELAWIIATSLIIGIAACFIIFLMIKIIILTA